MLIKIISNWFAVSSWKDVVDRTTWWLISALWRGSKQTTSNSWTRQSWFGLFRHSSLIVVQAAIITVLWVSGDNQKSWLVGVWWINAFLNVDNRYGGIHCVVVGLNLSYTISIFSCFCSGSHHYSFVSIWGQPKKLACGGLMDKCMLECWQSIRWNPLCRGGIESILHRVNFQLLLFRQPSLQFCGYLGTTKKAGLWGFDG